MITLTLYTAPDGIVSARPMATLPPVGYDRIMLIHSENLHGHRQDLLMFVARGFPDGVLSEYDAALSGWRPGEFSQTPAPRYPDGVMTDRMMSLDEWIWTGVAQDVEDRRLAMIYLQHGVDGENYVYSTDAGYLETRALFAAYRMQILPEATDV